MNNLICFSVLSLQSERNFFIALLADFVPLEKIICISRIKPINSEETNDLIYLRILGLLYNLILKWNYLYVHETSGISVPKFQNLPFFIQIIERMSSQVDEWNRYKKSCIYFM